ncbi:hypothetical protein WJX72_008924 [[Myrmecia] bisecta]|uniref:GmrSD restriction endonucleases N-terminal domain-containing protein n=1 Tax=[Myrmecia] bisecta TaxID=41462 RepID=A0AAW1PY89_9CHLO
MRQTALHTRTTPQRFAAAAVGCSDESSAAEEKSLETYFALYKAHVESKNYDLCDLKHKEEKGKLIMQPEYQRGFVWKEEASCKFIESVLLGLPVPEIWVHEREDPPGSKRMVYHVVDGKQRITSVISFMKGAFPGRPPPFRLQDLQTLRQLNGKAFKDLSDVLQARIEDYTIPARFLSSETGLDAIFAIYNRINSGGENLNNQQTRCAAFWGPSIRLLDELSSCGVF